jgi:hypothetical protein
VKKIERNSLEKFFDDDNNAEAHLCLSILILDASFFVCFRFDKFVELVFLFGKM